jgi:hypothetical protein
MRGYDLADQEPFFTAIVAAAATVSRIVSTALATVPCTIAGISLAAE